MTPLAQLRALFWVVVGGLLVVTAALAVLAGRVGEFRVVPVIVITAVGIACCGGTAGLYTQALACDDRASLAAAYRRRFFACLALAEVPVIVAFVAALATTAAWLYGLGLVFAGAILYGIAPTGRHVTRDGQRLPAECRVSLREALAA